MIFDDKRMPGFEPPPDPCFPFSGPPPPSFFLFLLSPPASIPHTVGILCKTTINKELVIIHNGAVQITGRDGTGDIGLMPGQFVQIKYVDVIAVLGCFVAATYKKYNEFRTH